MTITIVAINAKKIQDDTKTFFDNIHSAWDNKDNQEVKILHIDNIDKLNAPAEDVIIFHPKVKDNPDWAKEVENFMDFEFPEDKYYVFGDDGGHILKDIESKKPKYKECRLVKIPTGQGFGAIHGHVVAAVVLWERFKRRDNIPSIKDW